VVLDSLSLSSYTHVRVKGEGYITSCDRPWWFREGVDEWFYSFFDLEPKREGVVKATTLSLCPQRRNPLSILLGAW
jgi:hypothetical protein